MKVLVEVTRQFEEKPGREVMWRQLGYDIVKRGDASYAVKGE